MDETVKKMMSSMAVCGMIQASYLELSNGLIYKNFELLSINNKGKVIAKDLTPGEEEIFTFNTAEISTLH